MTTPTRTMFDGITPGSVPAGAQLYAAYLDGNWADFTAMVARYPGAGHVSIVVSAGHNEGQVLDVEKGDASPAESVGWVQDRRAAGADPTVYCNASTWPTVQAAFKARNVPQPHYWVANYSLGSDPAIPVGAVALQYADRGGYDVSVVADYWPGVDPVPATVPSLQLEESMPIILAVTPDPTGTAKSGQPGYYYQDGLLLAHIPDAASIAGLTAAGVKTAPVTAGQYQTITAAIAAVAAQAGGGASAAAIAAQVVAQIGADLVPKG